MLLTPFSLQEVRWDSYYFDYLLLESKDKWLYCFYGGYWGDECLWDRKLMSRCAGARGCSLVWRLALTYTVAL